MSRQMFTASTTLTLAMYQDDACRNQAWTGLPQKAADQARAAGLQPLKEGSWFANITYLKVGTDGLELCRVADAAFIKMTAEIMCEDTDAEDR